MSLEFIEHGIGHEVISEKISVGYLFYLKGGEQWAFAPNKGMPSGLCLSMREMQLITAKLVELNKVAFV